MKFIKRIIAAIFLTAICGIVAAASLVWMFFAIVAGSTRGIRLAVAHDQAGNCMAAGDEDETFSARCWRCRDAPKWEAMRRFVDWIFSLTGEVNHCKNSHDFEVTKAYEKIRAFEQYQTRCNLAKKMFS